MARTTAIFSTNPATGETVEEVAHSTDLGEVHRLAEAAGRAAQRWFDEPRARRSELLRAISTELEKRRPELVQLAMRESGLAQARLEGELTRTTYQARFFADVVDDGGFLEATIDHASDTPMGPGPDLRRMLVPLGPVVVFGASNFPFAFSVPGGDTVSAIAAGCPVILKAHDAHPALSRSTFEALDAAARSVDAPEGTFGLVFGLEAGAALVAEPAVKAVGFTGSLTGGQALLEIINARPEPIPFYGELASLNPVVMTSGAVRDHGAELGPALVGSVIGSGGQLCTKPGLALVPRGQHGDAVLSGAAEAIRSSAASTLLTSGIRDAYGRLVDRGGLQPVAEGNDPTGSAFAVSASLYEIEADQATPDLLHEVFGPTTLVVRYDESQLSGLLELLPPSLAGTVWSAEDETAHARRIDRELARRVGRVLHNGWPTGVIVGWAQQHGGPWPATNTVHTSVGASATRRWQRPVAWQNAPEAVLPPELLDGDQDFPRRVDGHLVIGTA